MLALKTFITAAKDPEAGTEVLPETIENLKRVFFYCYDFEHNSIFLKLFEVILASHVEPVKAFQILDSDKDGKVSVQDFIDMLQKLGLPLS